MEGIKRFLTMLANWAMVFTASLWMPVFILFDLVVSKDAHTWRLFVSGKERFWENL